MYINCIFLIKMSENKKKDLSFFTQYVKMVTRNFIMTRGRMLEGENSEFQVMVFCPLPKTDNSEFF